ncbi:MAG: hypothetical protein AAF456_17160 [Planctomycetota bacterium]
MNLRITPEIQAALDQYPAGPIRLDSDDDNNPVFLLRLDDIANLQEVVDGRIQEKLAEADADIKAGRVSEWDIDQLKRKARDQHSNPNQN